MNLSDLRIGRFTRTTTLLFTFLAVSGAVAQETKPTFKVVGLRVIAPPPKDNDDLGAFNSQPGTTLAVLIQHPVGGLISFDEDESKLTSLVDDTGTDLLKGENSYFGPFGSFPRFSEDQKAAMIEISGPGLPVAGAKAIRAQGVFKFQQATKSTKVKAESVKLEEGTEFQASEFKFVISEFGKSEWSDAPIEMTLQTKQNANAIRAVRFYDADGKEIESEEAGRGYMSFGSDVTHDLGFTLGTEVKQATIEIEYWENLKLIDVPFEVSTGVGLSK